MAVQRSNIQGRLPIPGTDRGPSRPDVVLPLGRRRSQCLGLDLHLVRRPAPAVRPSVAIAVTTAARRARVLAAEGVGRLPLASPRSVTETSMSRRGPRMPASSSASWRREGHGSELGLHHTGQQNLNPRRVPSVRYVGNKAVSLHDGRLHRILPRQRLGLRHSRLPRRLRHLVGESYLRQRAHLLLCEHLFGHGLRSR